MDRGACRGCGRVFAEGRPAARLPQETLAEKRERLDSIAEDVVAYMRGYAIAALDVAAFYMALRAHEASALRALERVMEQLVDFDLRCQMGDADGAAVQLRAWLDRVRGGGSAR